MLHDFDQHDFTVVTCVQMKIYLGAVVDGVFITDTAEELLKRKEVLKVPVIMGITNHEFGWILPQVTQISLLSFQTLTMLPSPVAPVAHSLDVCSLSPGINPL